MEKLIKGVEHFQARVFTERQAHFEQLASGQSPETLFITCSDSRVNPNMITQTEPGELFILRNAGNIVPPYGASNGGEEATIEYALAALAVSDIIICGHSHCGAMKALNQPENLDDLPAVKSWLKHAESTARVVRENYKLTNPDKLLNVTIQENVLMQLENLKTHPAVAAALSRDAVRLHGWVYKIETGEVFAYDHRECQFLPLRAGASPGAPGRLKLAMAESI